MHTAYFHASGCCLIASCIIQKQVPLNYNETRREREGVCVSVSASVSVCVWMVRVGGMTTRWTSLQEEAAKK